ncbi:MAG: hypothetical protein IT242_09165, partial [Bacteroidia bacterium]|nr:hypothetical protein [Bacteroidia bacterium]
MAAISVLTLASCQSPRMKLASEINRQEKILFGDSTGALNDSLGNRVLNMYLEYTKKFKDDTSSVEYIMKAADLATGLNKPALAANLYSGVVKDYPNHRKA